MKRQSVKLVILTTFIGLLAILFVVLAVILALQNQVLAACGAVSMALFIALVINPFFKGFALLVEMAERYIDNEEAKNNIKE